VRVHESTGAEWVKPHDEDVDAPISSEQPGHKRKHRRSLPSKWDGSWMDAYPGPRKAKESIFALGLSKTEQLFVIALIDGDMRGSVINHTDGTTLPQFARSLPDLASIARMCRYTAIQAMKALEARGVLVVERRRIAGRVENDLNLYTLRIPIVPAVLEFRAAQAARRAAAAAVYMPKPSEVRTVAGQPAGAGLSHFREPRASTPPSKPTTASQRSRVARKTVSTQASVSRSLPVGPQPMSKEALVLDCRKALRPIDERLSRLPYSVKLDLDGAAWNIAETWYATPKTYNDIVLAVEIAAKDIIRKIINGAETAQRRVSPIKIGMALESYVAAALENPRHLPSAVRVASRATNSATKDKVAKPTRELAIAIQAYVDGMEVATMEPYSSKAWNTDRAELAALEGLMEVLPCRRAEEHSRPNKIAAVACHYRRANVSRAQFERGYKPSMCLQWVNSGRPHSAWVRNDASGKPTQKSDSICDIACYEDCKKKSRK
jgi:hypothetical protein